MLGFIQNKSAILLFFICCFASSKYLVSQKGRLYTRISSQVKSKSYTPNDINNIWFWIDADDTTTLFTDLGTVLAKDGDVVRQWNDKSGNNFHVTQNTFSARGIYRYNQFNGRRVVDFDNNDWMEHLLGTNYSGDFSLYIILKSQDPTPNNFESFFASHNTPGTNGAFQIDYLSGVNTFQVRANDFGTQQNYQFAPFVANQIKLFNVEHDDAANTLKTYDNGNLITNGTGQNDLFYSRFRINSNRNSGSYHDSQIAEVIIFNKLLTNCEKYKMISYLNEKYSTSFTFTPTPGGVDCANNQVWLRADTGTSTTINGATINQWNDVTISAASFTQVTAANRPIYINNTTENINFNPVVKFNSGNKTLVSPSILGTSNSELTAFVVSKEITRTNNYQIKFVNTTGASRYSIHNPWSDNNFYWDVQGTAPPRRVQAAVPAYLTVGKPYLTTVVNSVANNKQEFYLDGTLLASDGTGHTTPGLDNTTIGTSYDGYIPEFIVYESNLNVLDKRIIQSYLAIKFGLTLGHNYYRSDSTIIFNVATYGNGVVGVGRDGITDLYQKKSRSESDLTDGLTIELTTDISSGVYAICGHNGGSMARVSLAGETNVLTRKWYSEHTGGVGTINLELDLAEMGVGTTPAAANVKILIANNPAFNNTHVIQATSVVGGIAYFTGIPLYDKYFTFSIP